jgi:hypothetical protein
MMVVGPFRPRKVWTAARVDNLAGETLTTLTKLGQAFERRQVQVGDDVVAWGQYLDANHFSASQWGFYGTSAALQTLAVRARARGEAPSRESLIARALLLPQDREPDDGLFAEKAEKQDFENVIKLAFVADALHLDHEESVPDDATPPLVDDLIDLAVSGERWSTRLPGDPDRESKDQDFATALIVSVLRRYERFRDTTLWVRSRTWLANRVLQDGSFREQRTLVALT